MYKAILLLVLTSLLSGCLASVAAGTAAVGGAFVSDPRSTKTVINDTNMSHQAAVKIAADKNLAEQTHIGVTTYDRVMLLTGQAPTAEMRQQAVDLAKTVANVKLIYNEISIGKPTPISARSKDAWLTTKVKSELLATQGFRSNDFKVVTEDNVVYLMGIVSRLQGELAAQTTSHVDGVKKVVTLFEYKEPGSASTASTANKKTTSTTPKTTQATATG